MGQNPHAAGASKAINLTRRDLRQFFETGEFPDDATGLRKRLHDEVRREWFLKVTVPRRLAKMREKARRRRYQN